MTIWIVVIGVAQVEGLADKTRGKCPAPSGLRLIHNFTFTGFGLILIEYVLFRKLHSSLKIQEA